MAEETLRYQLYFHHSKQRTFTDYRDVTEFYQNYLTRSSTALFPPDCPYFTGRQVEQQLVKTWVEQMLNTTETARIVAISGAAGIGKSTLAIRLAYQLRSRFPAFQLYANLRNVERHPHALNHILVGWLCALAVDFQSIPLSFADRLSLFQSLLAKRNGVILLDQVETIEQIQHLLPENSTSLVLITSLRPLTNLKGATFLDLPTLSKQEAQNLLKQTAGQDSLIQPDLVERAIALCSQSPLALMLFGHLLRRTSAPPEHIIQFAEAQREKLVLGNPEVQTLFLLIYQHLSPETAQLLRSISLLTDATFDPRFAAVLLNCKVEAVKPAIQQLLQTGLVVQLSSDQYRIVHPLIHRLARIQLASTESIADRKAIRLHLSQTYCTHACWMNLSLNLVTRSQIASGLGKTKSEIAALEQQLQTMALAWFTTEFSNLLAALEWMYQIEQWEGVLDLADSLVDFLQLRGCWHDLEHIQRHALEAARYLNSRGQEARVLNNLGNVAMQQSNWDHAKRCYQQSLGLLRSLQDHRGEAQSLINLGIWFVLQAQPELALSQWKLAIAKLPLNTPEYRQLRTWIQQAELEQNSAKPRGEQPQSIFQAISTAIKRLWQ